MPLRFKKNILLTLLSIAAPAMTFAQAATDAAPAAGPSFNVVLVGLVALMLILLLTILLLGNVVIQLSHALRDKMRTDRKNKGIAKALILLAFTGLSSVGAYAQDAAAPVSQPSVIAGMASGDFYLLAAIILLEMLVLMALILIVNVLIKQLRAKEMAASEVKPVEVNFWDRFNAVVPIEKEQDIMLDHDYDGIKELDNSLPPWWKYGFYLTIVVAFVYIWYYHAGGNGPSSHDEFVAEVEAGERAKAAYLAKSANNVDENTVTLVDATGIAAGQKLFQSNCAACHAADGGGGVGPNLTDEYWLHGGSLSDVFKSIKYGWTDKGMKSWKDDFSPSQIAQLASYIRSIKGAATAAPKEKQGELYIEGNTVPANDSGSVTTDTSKVVAVK